MTSGPDGEAEAERPAGLLRIARRPGGVLHGDTDLGAVERDGDSEAAGDGALADLLAERLVWQGAQPHAAAQSHDGAEHARTAGLGAQRVRVRVARDRVDPERLQR